MCACVVALDVEGLHSTSSGFCSQPANGADGVMVKMVKNRVSSSSAISVGNVGINKAAKAVCGVLKRLAHLVYGAGSRCLVITC